MGLRILIDRPDQGLQNSLKNECSAKFLTKYDLDIASFYGDCMKPGCIGKSHTNNLPTPTDLTENHYGKKQKLFWGESKIDLHGSMGNCCRIGTTEADF